MSEEEEIELCFKIFDQKWEGQEGDEFEDKEKFRHLNQEKGIEMSVIWKAYRIKYRGKQGQK